MTLAGVTPAMAELRGLAEQSLNEAHSTAASHGRAIGKRVRDAA